MKTAKKWLAIAGLLPLLALSGQAATTVLVNETFADGERITATQSGGTYTSLSWGARWDTAGTTQTGYVSIVNNKFEVTTRNETTWQSVIGQFGNSKGLLTSVGSSVDVSIRMAFTGNLLNNAGALKIGLFNSNGEEYSFNNNTGGTSATPSAIPSGYVLSINPGAGSGTNQALAQMHNTTTAGLINGGLVNLGSAGSPAGASPTFTLGTYYDFNLSVTLISASQVQIALEVKDLSSNQLISFSVVDDGTVGGTSGIVTTFDTIAFYNGSAGNIAQYLSIDSVQISSTIPIPEASSYAAVLGLLAIGAVMIWRRRR